MAWSYKDRTSLINKEFGHLVGRTISDIRPLTENECYLMGWNYAINTYAFIIILDDGTALIPSCDAEGNGQGHIFIEALALAGEEV